MWFWSVSYCCPHLPCFGSCQKRCWSTERMMPSAITCHHQILFLNGCWVSLFFAPVSLEVQRVLLQPGSWIFTELRQETLWVELSHRAYPIVYPKLSTFLLWALKTFIETSVFYKLKLIYLQSPKSSGQKGQLQRIVWHAIKTLDKIFQLLSSYLCTT